MNTSVAGTGKIRWLQLHAQMNDYMGKEKYVREMGYGECMRADKRTAGFVWKGVCLFTQPPVIQGVKRITFEVTRDTHRVLEPDKLDAVGLRILSTEGHICRQSSTNKQIVGKGSRWVPTNLIMSLSICMQTCLHRVRPYRLCWNRAKWGRVLYKPRYSKNSSFQLSWKGGSVRNGVISKHPTGQNRHESGWMEEIKQQQRNHWRQSNTRLL